MPTVDEVQQAAILAGAVGQTWFVIQYATRPWWRHFVGRALMVKSASLCLLLVLASVHMVVDYAAREYVEAVLYWLVVAGIWTQLVALLVQQRQDRDQRRRGLPESTA